MATIQYTCRLLWAATDVCWTCGRGWDGRLKRWRRRDSAATNGGLLVANADRINLACMQPSAALSASDSLWTE
ncbi:hypothetical protein R5R35_005280 [Gryllus longicercus]|uniref:Uncharacterized protein n=1 Tax=Gryllus longicercus TaxID=2509291 RepID=A0AAN9ZAG6_9ORTH